MVSLLRLGSRTALAVEMRYGSKWLPCVCINAGAFATGINCGAVGSCIASMTSAACSRNAGRSRALRSSRRRSVIDAPPLGLFHRPGGDAVGPIEEVGIVGRAAGDEQEVLLWAFQGRNGRL